MLFNYNFRQNQAFAQLYVAASSVAIVLWSASIMRSRTLAGGVAIHASRLSIRTGNVFIGLELGHGLLRGLAGAFVRTTRPYSVVWPSRLLRSEGFDLLALVFLMLPANTK
ncbi:MAG: hypothetical protein WBC04_19590 [Candidatus Acidiferrales bacterium]